MAKRTTGVHARSTALISRRRHNGVVRPRCNVYSSPPATCRTRSTMIRRRRTSAHPSLRSQGGGRSSCPRDTRSRRRRHIRASARHHLPWEGPTSPIPSSATRSSSFFGPANLGLNTALKARGTSPYPREVGRSRTARSRDGWRRPHALLRRSATRCCLRAGHVGSTRGVGGQHSPERPHGPRVHRITITAGRTAGESWAWSVMR